jgi:diguanylate cyclase (GGDEF)-like protein
LTPPNNRLCRSEGDDDQQHENRSARQGPGLAVLIRPWDGLRGIGPGLALLAVSVFALTALITLNLKHAGENGVRAENHLQSYISEMQIQDGLEWRVISGRMTVPAVRVEIAASRGRADTHLAEAIAAGLSTSTAADITQATQRYEGAVDQEMELLGQGRTTEALTLDQTRVDPVFGQVTALLDAQTTQLSARAGHAQTLGDAGVLLTVLLSLILVSVVQSRRRRLDVRNQATLQSEARYRTLIDRSSDLVLVVDRAGRASFSSPSAERLLRSITEDVGPAVVHSADEAGPVDFLAAVDPRDRERLSLALWAAVAESRSIGEFRLNSSGGRGTYEVTVQDLTANPSVGGLVLTAHDVTDRLAMHREMEHRALHDELTGLPNRALLFDRFERALLGAKRSGTSVGLLLLDLERFKEVNDTFGHHYGDELLRQIGPRLADVLRGVDTIARLGGDEFAVLLVDVGEVDAAVEVATLLLDTLAIPFNVEGVDLDVEASIGVVVSGQHGQDVITLMQHADIAMYVAKTQHLGVFAYDPSVDGHSVSKLAMVGDLRRALERDELVLYYQPKVGVITGDLVGVEALVRWKHPRDGLVLPEEFIPVAERTGLINPLTRHVLATALAQARTWIDSGRPLSISVNLSVRNLHDEHFAELVGDLLGEHDVPAELLELEVTESAIMIDPERAREMLGRLSALGVRISLDDFGVGYTSLSQLKALPISEIKIDRSFVMTMTRDRNDSLIVQSVISLGHNLGLTLVAEGVETESTLTTLARFGCDVAQGKHISEPLSAADLDAWRPSLPGGLSRSGLRPGGDQR